jgi:hypothetical protein
MNDAPGRPDAATAGPASSAAHADEAGRRSVGDLRRSALAQDVLLFCVAFTAGAVLVLLVSVLGSATRGDVWSLGRSDALLLGGLAAGELFLVWNNGWRQGVRGHSIGKHREGLAVVDRATGRPTGAARGLLRGLVAAVLLDLSVAAVPIGLPTVLRAGTPDAWHLGAAAYLALLVLLVPLLLGMRRGVLDRVAGTEVVRGTGAAASTSQPRRQALVVLDVIGVVGVLAVCAAHLSFVWPLIWRWPGLT